ncbi:sigma-54-dependent Fis family transcriptional regulator [Pacificibacter marinus]|uniref:Acetoin catabolism regulatory protein n=1 Tax=Pacificibacter marinus TaxID=658057 RepID=A0A1Y5T9E4_9RHOB|nr:sigma-54-dependent Fis family transcriptional regulator [Pacificibacter marinus]SEL09292.1 Transcriptional regulator of acetoin/glycerol metabolism [Pacificibacter marinus]SLN58853.1 Acetoin catabolism regulatory protein [Pacificibacter marinus]
MTDHQHIEEIGQVLDGTQTGRDTFVSASWRRCVELYGMDPLRNDPAHIVTEAELRDHRKQAEWMIAAARTGLQNLFRQVAGQNYVLILTDAQGVCVDYFGDDLFADELRGAGLYLGSNWAEELAGTSGVGACIVTQEPVTVHQDDHFGNAHTTLSCTAAPIFDSLGKLTAVLDISLLRSPTTKSSQNLAMSLVTTAARRVEMANLMAESRKDWVLRFSTSPEFLDVDPEVAVRLDGSGRVIGYTRGARRLFPEGVPILGQQIDAALNLSVDDLPSLMRDRPTEDRVVELRDGGALFGHAIAPQAPRTLRTASRLNGALAGLAGSDPIMARLLNHAEKLAQTTVPLLICGDTGTGKSKLARTIHMVGQANGFILLDCAGMAPKDLHLACNDITVPTTLLLRGIDALSSETASALTVLLDQKPNLRPLSTTCLTPGQLTLPRPLFHRLAGSTLTVPRLGQRQDLGWMIDRLLRRRAPDTVRLSPSARADLMGRSWSGNLRELEQVLDVAVALCEGPVIDQSDLPPPVEAHQPVQETLEQVLDACDWNMAQASRRLGVNRSTVLRRIRKAGLHPPD